MSINFKRLISLKKIHDPKSNYLLTYTLKNLNSINSHNKENSIEN